jgi:hypothetical protein
MVDIDDDDDDNNNNNNNNNNNMGLQPCHFAIAAM